MDSLHNNERLLSYYGFLFFSLLTLVAWLLFLNNLATVPNSANETTIKTVPIENILE